MLVVFVVEVVVFVAEVVVLAPLVAGRLALGDQLGGGPRQGHGVRLSLVAGPLVLARELVVVVVELLVEVVVAERLALAQPLQLAVEPVALGLELLGLLTSLLGAAPLLVHQPRQTRELVAGGAPLRLLQLAQALVRLLQLALQLAQTLLAGQLTPLEFLLPLAQDPGLLGADPPDQLDEVLATQGPHPRGLDAVRQRLGLFAQASEEALAKRSAGIAHGPSLTSASPLSKLSR